MLSTFLRGSSLLFPPQIDIGDGALGTTELPCEISMIDSIGESLAEEIPLDVEDEDEEDEDEEDEEDEDEEDESECVFM